LAQNQVHSLLSIVNASSGSTSAEADSMDVDQPSADTAPTRISETAILASLFGWTLVPPTQPPPTPKRASLSTRPSRSSTPALEHPPSPATTPSRNGTPKPFRFQLPSQTPKPENALLQCDLCQRRVGLWAFITPIDKGTPTPQEPRDTSATTTDADSITTPKKTPPSRSFDLLREHRSYCPYVVRSTIVPSLPRPSNDATSPNTRPIAGLRPSSPSLASLNDKNSSSPAVEGWKAILMIILRTGLAQRQRIEYTLLSRANGENTQDNEDTNSDADSVKAMVAGVRARGGRDLLRYVRQLLG